MDKGTPNLWTKSAARGGKPKELHLVIDPKKVEIRLRSALQLEAPPDDDVPAKPTTLGTAAVQAALNAAMRQIAARTTPNTLPTTTPSKSSNCHLLRETMSSAQYPATATRSTSDNVGHLEVRTRDLWAESRKESENDTSLTFSSEKQGRRSASHGRKQRRDMGGPLEVAQRSDNWNLNRKRKVVERKWSLDQGEMAECTFTPVIYTKLPHHMQRLSAGDIARIEVETAPKGIAQTPKSQQSTATHTRMHSLTGVQAAAKPALGKVLSPVTYCFTRDLGRFETRMKQFAD